MDSLFQLLLLINFMVNVEPGVGTKIPANSVNLALETVLEFDGKDVRADTKMINNVQKLLTKIKTVINNRAHNRRGNNEANEYVFTHFFEDFIGLLQTFEDKDLKEFFTVFDDEIRKYHYRGNKFHELLENLDLRKFISRLFEILKNMPVKNVRREITKFLKYYQAKKDENNENGLLEFLNKLYSVDDSTTHMITLLEQLQYYYNDLNRTEITLPKVLREGIRTIIFDKYSNLSVNARKDVKNRLEAYWDEFNMKNHKVAVTDKKDQLAEFEKLKYRAITLTTIPLNNIDEIDNNTLNMTTTKHNLFIQVPHSHIPNVEMKPIVKKIEKIEKLTHVTLYPGDIKVATLFRSKGHHISKHHRPKVIETKPLHRSKITKKHRDSQVTNERNLMNLWLEERVTTKKDMWDYDYENEDSVDEINDITKENKDAKIDSEIENISPPIHHSRLMRKKIKQTHAKHSKLPRKKHAHHRKPKSNIGSVSSDSETSRQEKTKTTKPKTKPKKIYYKTKSKKTTKKTKKPHDQVRYKLISGRETEKPLLRKKHQKSEHHKKNKKHKKREGKYNKFKNEPSKKPAKSKSSESTSDDNLRGLSLEHSGESQNRNENGHNVKRKLDLSSKSVESPVGTDATTEKVAIKKLTTVMKKMTRDRATGKSKKRKEKKPKTNKTKHIKYNKKTDKHIQRSNESTKRGIDMDKDRDDSHKSKKNKLRGLYSSKSRGFKLNFNLKDAGNKTNKSSNLPRTNIDTAVAEKKLKSTNQNEISRQQSISQEEHYLFVSSKPSRSDKLTILRHIYGQHKYNATPTENILSFRRGYENDQNSYKPNATEGIPLMKRIDRLEQELEDVRHELKLEKQTDDAKIPHRFKVVTGPTVEIYVRDAETTEMITTKGITTTIEATTKTTKVTTTTTQETTIPTEATATNSEATAVSITPASATSKTAKEIVTIMPITAEKVTNFRALTEKSTTTVTQATSEAAISKTNLRQANETITVRRESTDNDESINSEDLTLYLDDTDSDEDTLEVENEKYGKDSTTAHDKITSNDSKNEERNNMKKKESEIVLRSIMEEASHVENTITSIETTDTPVPTTKSKESEEKSTNMIITANPINMVELHNFTNLDNNENQSIDTNLEKPEDEKYDKNKTLSIYIVKRAVDKEGRPENNASIATKGNIVGSNTITIEPEQKPVYISDTTNTNDLGKTTNFIVSSDTKEPETETQNIAVSSNIPGSFTLVTDVTNRRYNNTEEPVTETKVTPSTDAGNEVTDKILNARLAVSADVGKSDINKDLKITIEGGRRKNDLHFDGTNKL